MKSKVYRVTPAIATKWLEKNTVNRNFSRARAERYAADMRDGHWTLNGEPIIFAGDMERLIDGQHRLHAVVLSGVAVECLVVWGVASGAFHTLGSGAARTLADVLKLSDEEHCAVLGAVLHLLRNHSMGRAPYSCGQDRPTKEQLRALLEEHPKVRYSVAVAMKHRTALVTPSITGFAHYVFSKPDRSDETKASRFVELLGCPENIPASHPVFMLHQRLVEGRASLAARLDKRAVVWLIFRAWNGFAGKERLRRLALPRGSDRALVLPDVA